jgi:hypothetical protein
VDVNNVSVFSSSSDKLFWEESRISRRLARRVEIIVLKDFRLQKTISIYLSLASEFDINHAMPSQRLTRIVLCSVDLEKDIVEVADRFLELPSACTKVH